MFHFILMFILLEHELYSLVKSSEMDFYTTELTSADDGTPLSAKNSKMPHLELVLNVTKNDKFESQFLKRPRADRTRKKKEKQGKSTKPKNKPNRTEELKRIHRNNEKDILIRNRTIEILKNGVRILSTNDGHFAEANKTSSSVNETLLEKILSSGASKPDLLISASGMYKLPIGGNIYKMRKTPEHSNGVMKLEGIDVKDENEDTNKTDTFHDQIIDYEYDYEGFVDAKDGSNRNDVGKSVEKTFPFPHNYESVSIDNNVQVILEQIIATLGNLTDHSKNAGCAAKENSTGIDPCSKWLKCKNHLEKAFVGQSVLPSCPCHYPSTIFYNDAIWDQNQKRFFRWRDASNEAERLDIYKPGAVYCIRSLLAQSGASISSQQCCYDGKLRLLTRGSGAGTVNFVSPDVSKALHDTVDVLPWRLCKGDFTRYNLARHPDNGNRCPVNPNQEQYELQVRSSRHF